MARSRSSTRSTSRKSTSASNLPRDLSRPEPTRNKRKPILIATEDEKSSRRYFESLRNHLKAHGLIVIADHQGSAPKNVVQAAKVENDLRRTESEKGFEDPFEEVWVVFDTEGPQNTQRQREAKNAIAQAK